MTVATLNLLSFYEHTLTRCDNILKGDIKMKIKKIIKRVISYPYTLEENAIKDLKENLKKINNAKNIKIIKMGNCYNYKYETEVEMYYLGDENE